MKDLVKADLYRYTGRTSGFLSAYFSFPGFRLMFWYRACNNFSKSHPLGVVARLWYKRLQVKFGFQIPHSCRIGKGLFLGHYGNIVINQGVMIGSNCNIAQGVTLGNISRGEKKGCPCLGDRVWIGANSVVVGKIKVGNDVLIAPLTLLNFDVPDSSVVAGNPARIINTNGSEGYIKNVL
jgi:serine O-acetyltransferase